MAESEKKSQGLESTQQKLDNEPQQRQQTLQSHTPDSDMIQWSWEQLDEVKVLTAGGTFQEALELLDAGLAKLRERRDLRLWESMFLTKKYLLLDQMGRLKEAQAVKEECDRLRGTFEEWSKT